MIYWCLCSIIDYYDRAWQKRDSFSWSQYSLTWQSWWWLFSCYWWLLWTVPDKRAIRRVFLQIPASCDLVTFHCKQHNVLKAFVFSTKEVCKGFGSAGHYAFRLQPLECSTAYYSDVRMGHAPFHAIEDGAMEMFKNIFSYSVTFL